MSADADSHQPGAVCDQAHTFATNSIKAAGYQELRTSLHLRRWHSVAGSEFVQNGSCFEAITKATARTQAAIANLVMIGGDHPLSPIMCPRACSRIGVRNPTLLKQCRTDQANGCALCDRP